MKFLSKFTCATGLAIGMSVVAGCGSSGGEPAVDGSQVDTRESGHPDAQTEQPGGTIPAPTTAPTAGSLSSAASGGTAGMPAAGTRRPDVPTPGMQIERALASIVVGVGPVGSGPYSSGYYLESSGVLTLECAECGVAQVQGGSFGTRRASWDHPADRFVAMRISEQVQQVRAIAALRADRRGFAYWPDATHADRSLPIDAVSPSPAATVTWFGFIPDPQRLSWRLSDGSFWSYAPVAAGGDPTAAGPRREPMPDAVIEIASTPQSMLPLRRHCPSGEPVVRPTLGYGRRADGTVVAWSWADPDNPTSLDLRDVVRLSQPTQHTVLALTASGDVYWVNRDQAVAPCEMSGSFVVGGALVYGGEAAPASPGPQRIGDLPGPVCSLAGDYAVLCSGDVYLIGVVPVDYGIGMEPPTRLDPSVRIDALAGIGSAALPTLATGYYRTVQRMDVQRAASALFIGFDGTWRNLQGEPVVVP